MIGVTVEIFDFITTYRTKYSRMNEVIFVEDSLTWSILEYLVPYAGSRNISG